MWWKDSTLQSIFRKKKNIETPSIYLVARPSIDFEQLGAYLSEVGGSEWLRRIEETEGLSPSAILCEFMGRNCYRSWAPGLNANVTRVREDSVEYLRNVLKSGHGSVFEHAQFSFVFHNVTRVFTHELVRHRAGVAISQESLRYVRLTDLGIRIPTVLEPHQAEIVNIVERLEEFQVDMAAAFGLDDEGVPFHYKKEVTSALRRLAPIGLTTTIGWSSNVRTLRHVIEQRTSEGAEEEIREVFQKVAGMLIEQEPALFGDYEQQEDGSYMSSLASKV